MKDIAVSLLFLLIFHFGSTYDMTFKKGWFPENSSKLWMEYIKVDLEIILFDMSNKQMKGSLLNLNNIRLKFKYHIGRLMRIHHNITRYIPALNGIRVNYVGLINVKCSPVGSYNHPYDWTVNDKHKNQWHFLIHVHPRFSLNITITTSSKIYFVNLYYHRHCDYNLLKGCDANEMHHTDDELLSCHSKEVIKIFFCVLYDHTPNNLWTTTFSRYITTNSLFLYCYFTRESNDLKGCVSKMAFHLRYQAMEKKAAQTTFHLSEYKYFPDYFYSFAPFLTLRTLKIYHWLVRCDLLKTVSFLIKSSVSVHYKSLSVYDGPGEKTKLIHVAASASKQDSQILCSTFQCYLILEISNVAELNAVDRHPVSWKMLDQTLSKVHLQHTHSENMTIFSSRFMNATVMHIYDIIVPADMRASVSIEHISKRPPETLGCIYANLNIMESLNGTTVTTFSLCQLSYVMQQITYVSMRNSLYIVAYQYGVYGTFDVRLRISSTHCIGLHIYLSR